MKRIDIQIEKVESEIRISQDTNIVIKLPSNYKAVKGITFMPTKSDIKIQVDIQGVLEDESTVEIDTVFSPDKSLNNIEYLLNAKVILTDKATASIKPNITVSKTSVKANHKVSIGRIEKEVLTQLQSKGLSEAEILRLIKEGITSF